MPMMPKGRYALMTRYMDRVGTHGTQMMYRTCTVQVNLDFASEADMVQKLRVALALQPVATALFANSPFFEGKLNGHKSWRSRIWRDLDPDRTGMLPFVFEDGFGFERYVDYALDVPMYFVYRDGRYIDALGQSFRDFLKGELPGAAGRDPDAVGLGRPPDHDLPRGADQEVHRDARRRRRPVAAALRAAGALGRADLRPVRARRRVGPREGLGRRDARGAARRRLGRRASGEAGGVKLHDLAREVLAIAERG
jgi:glutamate--cysteine ligase